MMLRRSLSCLLILALLLTSLLSLPVLASGNPSPTTSAPTQTPAEPDKELPMLNRSRAGGVCNANNGELLYSVNATAAMYPAASTKLMTALVVLEQLEGQLDQSVTVTYELIQGSSGVEAGILQGETLTVRQLLACLVIGCANDAALILARYTAGDLESFVRLMNEKALALDMKSTNYENPTGLHDDSMVTTVSDTLKLAAHLYRKDAFTNLCGRESFELPGTPQGKRRVIHNRNYLVSNRVVPDYYDSSITGMNYGSTYEAGGVVVASTFYKGAVYIAVVFGAQTENKVTPGYEITDEAGNVTVVPESTKVISHAFSEVQSLLKWAKEGYRYLQIISTANAVCEIPVRLGSGRAHVALFPAVDVELYLPVEATAQDIRTEFHLTEQSLTAPVSAGTIVGSLSIYYEDKQVATVDLVTRSGVDRSILDYYGEQITDFLLSPTSLRILLIALGVLCLYALSMSVWRHRARKKALLRRRTEELARQRQKEREMLRRWEE